MTCYRGFRRLDGSPAVHVIEAGWLEVAPLARRLDLRNHSPTGFEWGYEGSGPAQLALAILAHALQDDERALRFYRAFEGV